MIGAELEPHERRALTYVVHLITTLGPLSISQMAELRAKETGFKSKTTLQYAIRYARRNFLLRIAAWRRAYGTRGSMGPMYGLGDVRVLPDEPKPTSDRIADNRRYYESRGREFRGASKRYFNPWSALAWPDRHIPAHLHQTLHGQDGGDECGHLPPATADDWTPDPGEAELQILASPGRSRQRRSSP